MSKRILLVDDDAMNLRMAQVILKKTPYEILSASSGAECLRLLGEQPVDLVLLDIEMPDMNGIETLEKIREAESLSQLPVIFLSSSDDRDTLEAANRLQASGFINKPFIPQALLEQIAGALGD